jgi:galactoside O-acetyltransferase
MRFGFSPRSISIGPGARISRGSKVTFKGGANFDYGVSITARGGEIVFGENFHANEQVIFNADIAGSLTFGKNCLVGPRAMFRTANHGFTTLNVDIIDQKHESGDITIGNDVWIGAGVIVLPGVSIGDHCVIGAGAVVTQDIPPKSVAVGVPAKAIRLRTA